jgi:hypothetical protein
MVWKLTVGKFMVVKFTVVCLKVERYRNKKDPALENAGHLV